MTFVVVSAFQCRWQRQNTTIATAPVPAETRTPKLERIADELLYLTKLESRTTLVLFRLKIGLNRYGPVVSTPNSSGSATAGSGSVSADTKEAEKLGFKYLRLISHFLLKSSDPAIEGGALVVICENKSLIEKDLLQHIHAHNISIWTHLL
ncbi:hypothetical protein PanWU01x14_236350 [Parasponia andersonii]|uniref:Uncharacterized protein n=1 Tax=Parasponia andersonii TaxID=3476 RepID=A0A2P5BIB4_PARAD|nr:hypothetical protein PanWU01x14_236350 [Parasponia andersonii]